MKNKVLLAVTLALSISNVFAQTDAKGIYPWTPIVTPEFQRRLIFLTENQDYISDIREMDRMQLKNKNTKSQPWGGSYWPLIQGMVANNYQEKDLGSRDSSVLNHLGTYFLRTRENTSWKYNFKKWEDRKKNFLPKLNELKESELAEMAPTEKYDVLLGDTNFTLTNVIWDYTAKRGEEKKIPFLKSIEMPEGYKLGKESHWMAFWEGICHGWAPAAGHFARPEKTVWVTLPNGKKMPFYPNDLKALISLLFANSEIQGKTKFEGIRCDEKDPPKDEYGRYYDDHMYKGNSVFTPNCADVHPGVFHVAILNVLGIEGRSFVVEKAAKDSVSNQPVSGYEFVYFNPKTGNDGTLDQSMMAVSDYPQDPYKSSRNTDTASIVGIHMKLKYVDWENAVAEPTNYPSDDKIKDVEFKYDLEINAQGQIIGGQWRVNKDGSKLGFRGGETHQPDFFWVIPRDWKADFQAVAGLPAWDFASSSLPPKEFMAESMKKVYKLNPRMERKCHVESTNGGPDKDVNCVTQEPGPQPLVQVIDTLLEQSRK